ncbi:MAG: glycosyltransferase, partial [Gaiellaceae bacterium]
RAAMGAEGRRLSDGHPDAGECAARLAAVLTAMAGRPGAALVPSRPVTVVTTVLDEGPAIDTLLDLLLPQLADEDEIVVVDGGSSDDTADRIRARAAADARVRALLAPGTNIPAGRNRGIADARNDVIACTDAGCAPAPEWLAALKAGFGERLGPDLLTGTYRVAARTSFEHAMAAACYPDLEEARRPGPLARLYGRLLGLRPEASLPTGRSSAFTREAWSRVGGFPEDLPTAEDVTFGRAIAAAGGRCLLCLDAEVTWEQRPSARSTARMYYRYGAGGGRSGDPLIVGRDLVRAAAYGLGPLAFLAGGRLVRSTVLAGAAFYVSVPLLRARKRPRPLAVCALVPAALALKDVSKAAGCLASLLRRGA